MTGLNDITPHQLMYSNFASYIGGQYPKYEWSKHNLAIAGVMERVESGAINRLIVNMPPRHGKTMQISEFFPAWYLGRNPENQVIFTTYSFDRASDCGRKVRNQMSMPLHKTIFKGCHLSKDAAGANRIGTDEGGVYAAVGVHGTVVGRGAHLFIIDDPIKGREDADSNRSREKLLDWYRGVAYTRLMKTGSIVLVMTRWHFDDLAGFLEEEMKHENWATLKLPAIAEEDNDPIGRMRGEPLWPAHYDRDRLELIKTTIGTREWNAQYQQVPLPSSGGMIQLDWFQKYNWKEWAEFDVMARRGQAVPHKQLPFGIIKLTMSWDTAFKEDQLNDPSACTVWGTNKQRDHFLLKSFSKRMKYPELKKCVIKMWNDYSNLLKAPIPLLIEDKASGQSLIQDLQTQTRIPVIKRPANSAKQTRMSTASPLIEAGKVFVPDTPLTWLVDFETELSRFPLWRHDDIADSTSQYLAWAGTPKYRRAGNRIFWK